MYTLEISVPWEDDKQEYLIGLPSLLGMAFDDVVESGSGAGLGFRDMDFTFCRFVEAFEAFLKAYAISEPNWNMNLYHQMWLP